MSNKKLSLGTYLGYGIGSIGVDATFFLFTSFGFFFLTTVVGISPAITGIIMTVAIVWDAISDPIIGMIIDRSKSKYGKKRPFIIGSAVPLGLIMVLVFTDLGLQGTMKNAVYLILVLGFWTAFTVFNIPYYTLGAELTSEDTERTKMGAWRQAFGYFGQFCATSLSTFLVGVFVKRGIEKGTAWSYAVTIIAIIAIIAIIIMWISTKGKEPQNLQADTDSRKPKVNIFMEVLNLWKFKPYVLIVVSSFFACVCTTLFFSSQMYFATFSLGVDEGSASILYTVMNLGSVLLLPVVAKVAIRFDKKMVYAFGLSFSGIVMIAARFAGIDSLTGAMIYVALCSVGNSVYWVLVFNLVYDVIDYNECKTGVRRDGVIFSTYSFIIKLGGAFASWIMGVMLTRSGFNVEIAAQSQKAVSTITSLFTVYPGIFMIVSGFAIFMTPLTRVKMDKIQEKLKKKRA